MIYDRDPTLRSSAPPYAPGDPEVELELEGTVGDPVASPKFKFKSADDSNVVVRVGRSGSGAPRIEIGVYYV